MIHWSWLVDAFRSLTRAGIATLRTVLSRLITARLVHITARAHHRRRSTVASSISKQVYFETSPFRNLGRQPSGERGDVAYTVSVRPWSTLNTVPFIRSASSFSYR